jgi:tRNA/tmRNA/rRNA uracil-C5-methylase (TrmA/RlmC/RlmD family)
LIINTFPKGCVKECPACKHRDWSIEDSLNQKLKFLSHKLLNWTDLIDPVRTVSNEKRWGYRNKTVLNAHWNGIEWQFGMITNDNLIPIPDCPVHAPIVRDALKILSKSLPSYKDFPLSYIVQSSAQIVLIRHYID